jgi:hypothetical protein
MNSGVLSPTYRHRARRTVVKAVFPDSGKPPSLAQMIRDSRADQQIIKRATQEALRAWFRQSERLNIARREYRLRGPRFIDFARRIGVTDQSSAYQLVKLLNYRAKIIGKCVDDAEAAAKRGEVYRYPGWETALSWFYRSKNLRSVRTPSGRYWLTPTAVYRKLDVEFHFDFDPCPYPLPRGFNSLAMEWGQRNFVNPPFRRDDVIGGKGVTAFIRKAISEQAKGKTSVVILPIFDYVALMLSAGAEIKLLGRVSFCDVDSNRAAPHPANIAMFVLRGKPPLG